MPRQEEPETPPPGAPTPALAAFEPFVRWLLAATPEQLAWPPPWLQTDAEAAHVTASTTGAAGGRAGGGAEIAERLALAEAEGEFEAAWDLVSLAQREREALRGRERELRRERDESREHIALLERRIIKRLQDRDLAIAQRYTTEQQIRDAERFKTQPSQPTDGPQSAQTQTQTQAQTQQRRTRVALAIRGLLQRHGRAAAPAYSEKDVQQLQRELADTKVDAALAKAERDSRRHALRALERRCGIAKLELAQARAEEDDLQATLQQSSLARRSSAERLQQISRFSTDVCSPRGADVAPRKARTPPPARPFSPWTSPSSWRRAAPVEATAEEPTAQ